LLINANRNAERYAALGYRVVPDAQDGFLGPLAGMASGLAAATTDYIVSAPCDSPLLVTDLVERLGGALLENNADIAVAHDGERTHPVFLLLRRELLDDLNAFLASGGRKIDLWFARHRLAMSNFSDCPEAFVNINDADERKSIENLITETA
jgi:molybdopterin-guanine dinucleotide biosynthesis protein A